MSIDYLRYPRYLRYLPQYRTVPWYWYRRYHGTYGTVPWYLRYQYRTVDSLDELVRACTRVLVASEPALPAKSGWVAAESTPTYRLGPPTRVWLSSALRHKKLNLNDFLNTFIDIQAI